MKKKTALRLIEDELARAIKNHGGHASPHEAYAVLLEEVDELWAEIKADNGRTHRGASEAVQIASVALSYLIHLVDEPVAEQHERKVRRHMIDWDMRERKGGCYSG